MKRLMTILAMVVIATMVSVVSKAQGFQPQRQQVQGQPGTPLAIRAVFLAPAVSDSANVVVVQINPRTVLANDSAYVGSISIKWALGYIPASGKGRVVLASDQYSATLPNTAKLSDIKSRIQSFYPSGFIVFK